MASLQFKQLSRFLVLQKDSCKAHQHVLGDNERAYVELSINSVLTYVDGFFKSVLLTEHLAGDQLDDRIHLNLVPPTNLDLGGALAPLLTFL